jgi:hypothetical protein
MSFDEDSWRARGKEAYVRDLLDGLPAQVSADSARHTLVFLFFDELGALSAEDTDYAIALAIGSYLEAHRERLAEGDQGTSARRS